MNIEIVGVHHANKGALLMLEAIRERLRDAFPLARLAVPGGMPSDARLRHGLHFTPSTGQDRWLAALPTRARRKMGLMRSDEVDVVLDSSGFGYGDHWGLAKLERRLTRRLAEWKRPGRAAILLPQALGPFDKPGMADAFRAALSHLDLAFARDRISLEHALRAAPGARNLRLAPDFTNLLKPALPTRLSHLAGRSFVIPNQKMIGEGGGDARRRYVRFLALAAERIEATGRAVDLLIHEGVGDRALAAEVNAARPTPLALVDEPSPLVTKAVIASADLIVSSRFHGLVSALAAGVPALACGWSHKYAELMRDYGCADALVDVADEAAWSPALDRFLGQAADPTFRAALAAAAAKQRALSEAMWSDVIAVIGAAAPDMASRRAA